MKVFVLMPFAEEFDDVYHIIRDAVESVRLATSTTIECYRADDIDDPGKISEQVLSAIRSSDLVIAELTGSNPNVMYELGFAHALEKPAIILNQAVHNSPFDVKDFRQITYDRNRLLKDCRPSLIASITSVAQKSPSSQVPQSNAIWVEPVVDLSPSVVRPSSALTKQVQEINLEISFLKNTNDRTGAVKEATKLLDLLSRVSVVGASDSDNLRNSMGSAGNCAVQLEQMELSDWAEKIYRKVIGIFPSHEGVHLQYADLLADLGRMDEAKEELNRARSIDPNDERLPTLETKIAMGVGAFTPEFGMRLREDFYANPGDQRRAAAFLMFLTEQKDTAEFEKACNAWESATDDKYSAKRSFADYLASSRSDELRRRAIDKYRELQPICPAKQQAPMMHNLATLLYHFDMDAEAESTWRAAYAMDPNNVPLQSAFSQLLERKGDLESARTVTRGLPLPTSTKD